MNVFDYFKSKPHDQERALSIGDPALAEYLGLNTYNAAGVNVNESSSLGLTAVYRSVSLIAGTIGTLPLKTYRTLSDDSRERATSFLDNPGGPTGLTPMAWKELVMVHLLLHGNAYLLHRYNVAGALIGLQPIHPRAVSISFNDSGRKIFTVQVDDSGVPRKFTSADLTHILAMSLDGVTGLSPIQATRNAIGTGIAGDTAAAKMFRNGLLLGGVVSGEGITQEQGQQIKAGVQKAAAGFDKAGDILVVNKDLTFSKWTMTADDAQFIESRKHQVDEVSRIFGVPKTLLAEDGASTWGSGIAELIEAMQKFTFTPWTKRIEEALSGLVGPSSKYVEFDYAGLLRGTPSEVTDNLIKEVDAGLRTRDEARKLLNLPPLTDAQKEELKPPAPVVVENNDKTED